MNKIFEFMKKHIKIIVAVLIVSIGLLSFNRSSKVAPDPEKDRLLLELLTFVIEKAHYSPSSIDNEFSKGVYKDYINALDNSKRFFLKSDIDEFSKYETEIDNQLLNKDLSFFNLTYNRLMQRMSESKLYYKAILNKPFDFTIDESIDTDYENMPYANNVDELKERWRKQIKLSTLSSLVDKFKLEENATEKTPYIKLEEDTRNSALKSLDEYFSFMSDMTQNEWFSVYINSITSRFDPHTNYFAPEAKDKFDIDMSGKLEGIGARLQKKNDYTEISELISGGPAWRGKQLEAGDVILKVAQGPQEPLDIVGMRLDDVVKKIKGPKGTEVRLTVKKVDNSIKVISIIRDIVEIEETYAKTSIVEKDGKKYGVIYLPKFYIDFENKDGRDAYKDIKTEIARLKVEDVSGLILDVRDDGGGSLSTVVDIAGLFIEDGPIVQVKSSGLRKDILADKDDKIQWDGPLVIMINSFSASASEILAAAIQDYNRGIIIGSKQSYGKGTVQNIIDLNQFVKGNVAGDLGALKTTTQKFYRINGGSTQLEGVKSDIIMPDRYSYLKMGERDIDNAMKWDKIESTFYKKWKDTSAFQITKLKSKHRILNSNIFKMIEENAKWIDSRSKENIYSLNIQKFRMAQTELDEKSKLYKTISDYKTDLKFSSLPYEIIQTKNDTVLAEKRKRWHESLAKDAYVEEALNILDDLQTSRKSKPITADFKK
jgi:carboxyl-terminal processing protease